MTQRTDELAVHRVDTLDDLCELVRGHARVVVRGGGSKPGLVSGAADAVRLDLSALRGVSEYDPAEFTFTAAAATPLREVKAMLAEHGQYLPFDPPLAEAGATLGGTVAAGLSGPGRLRYGGVRDFLIGIRFVDGRGVPVQGGGKVVKNAAGFDLPKLMVGSLGRLGILTEVTFKVFPAPPATASLRADFPDLGSAVDALVRLTGSHFDVDALELAPAENGGCALWLRLGGLAEALPGRLRGVATLLSGQPRGAEVELFDVMNPPAFWDEAERLAWRHPDRIAVRIPVTPRRLGEIDPVLAREGASRRYSGGGTTLWLGWRRPLDDLDALLLEWGLAGLCLEGSPRPWIGRLAGASMLRRVALALDPDQKFGALEDYPERGSPPPASRVPS